MKFEDVIGQEAVKSRLMQLSARERVPHALLLCGPAGSGKLALATAFASLLISESTRRPSLMGLEPDVHGEAMLAKLEHPDLHFTYPTIKTPSMGSEHQPVSADFSREWHDLILQQGCYVSIDQWLDAMGAANQQAIITAAESDELARKLSLKSSQGGYKVSIIWLPERMNIAAANKLLKLLEEPPSQTVFIMVSQEPERLLETIRSRTQRINVPIISTEAVEQALVAQRGIEADEAHLIARLSNGSWIQALEALDTGNERDMFHDMFAKLMRLAYQRKVAELRQWSDMIASFGRERQKRLLSYFQQQIRENFVYNFGLQELNYLTRQEEAFSHNFARYINEANVIEMNELLEKAQRDIGQNANAKIVFFDLAMQVIVLLLKK